MQRLRRLRLRSRRQYVQHPECDSENQLALHSMNQLELFNSAQRSDEYYREQWDAFYAERRRLLNRMAWLVAGLALSFCSLSQWSINTRRSGTRWQFTARFFCLHCLNSGSSLCGGSGVGPVHDVESISSVRHVPEIYPGGDADTADFFDPRGQKLTITTTKMGRRGLNHWVANR